MMTRKELIAKVAVTKYEVGGPDGSAQIDLALSRIKIEVLTEALKYCAYPSAHTMNKTNVAITALADMEYIK